MTDKQGQSLIIEIGVVLTPADDVIGSDGCVLRTKKQTLDCIVSEVEKILDAKWQPGHFGSLIIGHKVDDKP